MSTTQVTGRRSIAIPGGTVASGATVPGTPGADEEASTPGPAGARAGGASGSAEARQLRMPRPRTASTEPSTSNGPSTSHSSGASEVRARPSRELANGRGPVS